MEEFWGEAPSLRQSNWRMDG